jgi:hypothetical protein
MSLDKSPEPCHCCNYMEAWFYCKGNGWVKLKCDRCGHKWYWKNTVSDRRKALQERIDEMEQSA